MVQHFDLDKVEHLFQLLSDLEVRLRGFGDTARVIVGEDNGGGVVLERLFEYFARVDRRTIDGAAEKVFAGDELVALIQLW